MPQPINGFPIDGFKSVTVLTDDLIVYQGHLEHGGPRKHDDVDVVAIAGKVGVEADIRPQYLVLALSCIPTLLVPTGTSVYSVALYDVFPLPGLVKINIDQIISISDFDCQCTASDLQKNEKQEPTA